MRRDGGGSHGLRRRGEDIGGSDDGAGFRDDGSFLYGAVAVGPRPGSDSQGWGIAWNHQGPQAANRRAAEICSRSTGSPLSCTTQHFGGCNDSRCGALALTRGVHPLDRGDTRAEAEETALFRRRHLTDNPCRFVAWACND